eukprot:s2443_g6.t1
MAVAGGSDLEREFRLHVLEVPAGMEDIDGSTVSMALIVLTRRSGMLLAVPQGVFAEETLAAGTLGDASSPIGLSHLVSVAAGHKVNLADKVRPVQSEGDLVDVLLVDVTPDVSQHLVPFDYQAHPIEVLHSFNANEPELMPMPSELAQAAWDWIRDPGSGELITYYSAEEGDLVPETPPLSPGAAPLPARRRTQANGGGGDGNQGGPRVAQQTPKKPKHTVASLAASIDQVNAVLPSLVEQLEKLSLRTETMENQIRGEVSRPSALRTPLGTSATAGLSVPLTTPAVLAKEFPVPKGSAQTGSLPSGPRHFVSQEVEQLEEEKGAGGEPTDLAKAVLAQSQAISTLMQQLTGGDPIQDLSSATTSLSSKGSVGRVKLQQELAAQKGTFFNAVIQSMARRMQPARSADQTPSELFLREVTPTAYVERFGGYGRSRDLGCLQWQVAMILDHLQNDNVAAARDGAALMAVCLEQAALDNGRLDIGLLLALADDPPSGVFQNRAGTTYARGRTFAPLADQRWITIALAYIKEMDLIASKRMDAIGGRQEKDVATSSGTPGPKKNPKKPKGGGRGRGNGQQKEEED